MAAMAQSSPTRELNFHLHQCPLSGGEAGLEILWVAEPKQSRCTLRLGNVVLDLMGPNNEDGALAKSIEKRGEGLGSICFNVKSLSSLREKLAAKGIELVNYREYHGNKVAFIHPRDACGVVIELIEPASTNP